MAGFNMDTQGRCRQCRRGTVAPEHGVECLLCGDVMKTLGTHLLRLHGMTAKEYRRRFNAPTAGEAVSAAKRADAADMIHDGRLARWEKRTHCARGHRLWGRNIMLREGGGRRCRRCFNEYHAAYHQRTYDPAKQAERYAANREKLAAEQREYRKRHPERVKATNAKSRAKNREKNAARERARYRRKKGLA